MTHYLSLLLLLSPLSVMAKMDKKPPARTDLLSTIEKSCLKKLEKKEERRTCACISQNLSNQLSNPELDLLARSYGEDPTILPELQNPAYNDLLLINFDITEGCMEDPNYKSELR